MMDDVDTAHTDDPDETVQGAHSGQTIDWAYVEDKLDAYYDDTRLLAYPGILPGGEGLCFEVQPPTQADWSKAEEAAVQLKRTRDGVDFEQDNDRARFIKVKTCTVNAYLLPPGFDEEDVPERPAPDGWRPGVRIPDWGPNEHQARKLPPWVRDDLVDAIDRFHELDEEAIVAFREDR